MHYIKKTFFDIFLFSLSFYAAFLIRFNFHIPAEYVRHILVVLPFIIMLRITIFFIFKIYNNDYGYFSSPDALSIFYATLVSSTIIYTICRFFSASLHIEKSIIIIDGLLLFILANGMRFVVKSYRQGALTKTKNGKQLLIIGAGDAADSIIREIKSYNHYGFFPAGLTDDSPLKKGKIIQGVKVLGTSKSIPRIVQDYKIETALIAIPSATKNEISAILKYCQDLEIQILTMPFLKKLNKEKLLMNQLNEVTPEDFLFREKVELDGKRLVAEFSGKRVMVTGAGGSIGSELCRQLAQYNPQELLIFERSEFNLFSIDQELKQKFSKVAIRPIIGDVSDFDFTLKTIQKYRPSIIFHAAAYKHVSLVELNPEISIKNNVIGTMNVVQAAVQAKVDKFVFISTDKAANPTSVMGATKRISEEYVRATAKNNHNNHFYGVRFGNVLGSSGSVLQIFKDQVAQGGPVTVSDQDVYRYFMTISEAVQLVLQTTMFESGGEIFILDMGEPVRIYDLAKRVIYLSGFKPGQDIEIIFTGLKKGEKYTEDLFEKNEKLESTPHKKIFRVATKNNIMKLPQFTNNLHELYKQAKNGNETELIQKLTEILPQFKPAHFNKMQKGIDGNEK